MISRHRRPYYRGQRAQGDDCFVDSAATRMPMSLTRHTPGDRQVRFDCEPAKEHLQVVLCGAIHSPGHASFIALNVTLQALEKEIGVMQSKFLGSRRLKQSRLAATANHTHSQICTTPTSSDISAPSAATADCSSCSSEWGRESVCLWAGFEFKHQSKVRGMGACITR